MSARVAADREQMEAVITEHMNATGHGMSIEGPFEDGHYEITCLGCTGEDQDQR